MSYCDYGCREMYYFKLREKKAAAAGIPAVMPKRFCQFCGKEVPKAKWDKKKFCDKNCRRAQEAKTKREKREGAE